MKAILLAVLMTVLALNKCVGTESESIKRDILELVEENYETLTDAINKNDYETLRSIEGIRDIETSGNYIVFYCRGEGIAPSSQEYGFYYSHDDSPTAIFDKQPTCERKDLKPKGDGYEYIDSSYNIFYTEKIIGHFYYYDNSF